MDLALLVYGISLLSGFTKFVVFIIVISILWIIGNGIHYSDRCEDGTVGAKNAISRMWKAFWIGLVSLFLLIFIPTEKTAYTMVGAYAAQKVAENDKVQQMSGKVLTIIEQKLDGYIDDGFKEAEEKLSKEPKRQRKL
jgi:energy-coupling factor transporter transmembrane protein EcfT